MPAATAAPAPPLDPPVVLFRFHGLRHAPSCNDSVVTFKPNSGVFVLPNSTKPAAR